MVEEPFQDLLPENSHSKVYKIVEIILLCIAIITTNIVSSTISIPTITTLTIITIKVNIKIMTMMTEKSNLKVRKLSKNIWKLKKDSKCSIKIWLIFHMWEQCTSKRILLSWSVLMWATQSALESMEIPSL